MAKPRVFIERLKLTDFRNHAALSLDLDARHVVLAGSNGVGKTNLLEAVSLLSPGRGLRRAAYPEMVRIGAENGFTVFGSVDGMAGQADIGTSAGGAEAGAARKVRINGTNSVRAEDLLDHLRLLWLTPALDGLFSAGGSERRRFLDRLVLTVDPAHGRRVLDYERAMRGRNRLLSDGTADAAWLDAVERQMAELGTAISAARAEMIGLLSKVIDGTEDWGPFPKADISVSDFLGEAAPASSADREDLFLARLEDGRRQDAAAGRTLCGPHRDDLDIRFRQKAMEAARSSTGEQKALLIGLVLAHARLVASLTGHAPLLLLDEIAAHLDEARRAALFDLIERIGGQAFMTGTDAAMFSALGDRALVLSMEDGVVRRIKGGA